MYLKKFKWLLSDFKLFCSSDFPFLYIQENFLKKLWKQFNWVLSNFKLFCDSDFPFLHILENVLKNFETQNISKKCFEKFWNSKYFEKFWKETRKRYQIFLKKKKKKGKKRPGTDIKIILKKKKKKSVSIIVIETESFWRRKTKQSWVYEKLFFST